MSRSTRKLPINSRADHTRSYTPYATRRNAGSSTCSKTNRFKRRFESPPRNPRLDLFPIRGSRCWENRDPICSDERIHLCTLDSIRLDTKIHISTRDPRPDLFRCKEPPLQPPLHPSRYEELTNPAYVVRYADAYVQDSF